MKVSSLCTIAEHKGDRGGGGDTIQTEKPSRAGGVIGMKLLKLENSCHQYGQSRRNGSLSTEQSGVPDHHESIIS